MTVLLLFFSDISVCGEFLLLFLGVMIDVAGGGAVDCFPRLDVEVVLFTCFGIF